MSHIYNKYKTFVNIYNKYKACINENITSMYIDISFL